MGKRQPIKMKVVGSIVSSGIPMWILNGPSGEFCTVPKNNIHPSTTGEQKEFLNSLRNPEESVVDVVGVGEWIEVMHVK